MEYVNVYFDETCPFCKRCVAFFTKRDKRSILQFDSLSSVTDKEYISIAKQRDSLILVIKNGKEKDVYIYGKAALRIFNYLEAPWKWISIFSYLPKFLIDPIYRVIAKNRVCK